MDLGQDAEKDALHLFEPILAILVERLAELRRHRRRLAAAHERETVEATEWNKDREGVLARDVDEIVGEGLEIWSIGNKESREAKVAEVLDAVGIDPRNGERRPHEFSGGQCQRISIARAVVTEPKLIICDEPVSALDVSVQAQILNLLQDMKQRYGLTLIFIAHDLAVVKNVSDRVMVMYLGKVCEVAPPDALYEHPAHPYTAALLAAIPVPDPEDRPDETRVLGGEIPSPVHPPSGCRFRTRCPRAGERCPTEEPELREIAPGQFVACHYPLEQGETVEFGRTGAVVPA